MSSYASIVRRLNLFLGLRFFFLRFSLLSVVSLTTLLLCPACIFFKKENEILLLQIVYLKIAVAAVWEEICGRTKYDKRLWFSAVFGYKLATIKTVKSVLLSLGLLRHTYNLFWIPGPDVGVHILSTLYIILYLLIWLVQIQYLLTFSIIIRKLLYIIIFSLITYNLYVTENCKF